MMESLLYLLLIVGHGDNGEDEIDQVEGTNQNVEDEEDDVIRAVRHQGDLTLEKKMLD